MPVGAQRVTLGTLADPRGVGAERHGHLVGGVAHDVQGELNRLIGAEVREQLGAVDPRRCPDQRIDVTQRGLVPFGEFGVLVVVDRVVEPLGAPGVQRGSLAQRLAQPAVVLARAT